MRPPIVRGCFESITIQGRGSSGSGFQPELPKAASGANPGSALDALNSGGSVGPRFSISSPEIQTVPLPPSPATMANSIEPSCRRRPPLEGPQPKSMSRLLTSTCFHRAGRCRSRCTCRQTFWPVVSTSFSSRLFTGPRPRRRNLTAYSSGMSRFSARRATTNPPPCLKSKSSRNAGTRPASSCVSRSSALPETTACHSSELTIPPSHRGGKDREQSEQHELGVKITALSPDGCIVGRGAGFAPADESQCGRDGQQPDDRKTSYLGPEESVMRVVSPSLGGKDYTAKADDYDGRGEDPVPQIDRGDAGYRIGAHARPHDPKFGEQDCKNCKYQQMMRNGQHKVEHNGPPANVEPGAGNTARVGCEVESRKRSGSTPH